MASPNALNPVDLIHSSITSMPLPSQTHPIQPPNPSTALVPQAHPSLPPPPEMQSLMDKTAIKTVDSQNAFEFERLLRHKQASNPQFAFLFRGHPWNHYYEWKKVTLEQQLQIQQNKSKNSTKTSSTITPTDHNTLNNTKSDHNPNTINIDGLHKILSGLNGSNHSINSASKWIINHKDTPQQVCDELKAYFTHHLCNTNSHKDPNIFDKKLYILFMINDVLHQAIKQRVSIDQIDPLSLHLSSILLYILPNAHNGYSTPQQQKVMSLVTLWSERSIFPMQLIAQLKDTMINDNTTALPSTQPQTPGAYMYPTPFMNAPVAPPPLSYYLPHAQVPPHSAPLVLPHPAPFNIAAHGSNLQIPKNTLHLSIGYVTKIALDLRRTGGGGTYVPLPMDKVPMNKPSKNKDSSSNGSNQSKFKHALDEYWRELCLIDPRRKKHRSSKRSKESKSRRRRRYDSRSRSRSVSRSRSRSRSTSSSF
eukprot:455050_1